MALRKINPVPLERVKITGGFWKTRQEVNRKTTIPESYRQLVKTGRVDAFRRDYTGPRHIFWDSDVAKWVETACYSLVHHPDQDLEKTVEGLVDLIIGIQEPDGYLNSYFTNVEPENRWTNVRDRHELYCAGHLMEAAVAHARAMHSNRFVDAMARYADYIGSVFGREEGKLRGYPGHEEIELALVKLARYLGEPRHAGLARYFVEERGEIPYYFQEEARRRGEPMEEKYPDLFSMIERMKYWQAHAPIREQDEAVGHAVRACYFYAGATDVADEFEDESLLNAVERIWEDIAQGKVYITGGVGARYEGEAFGEPYELPNEDAYAETCAAIALVFFNHRLAQVTMDGKYVDMMERSIYNGVLSGVSLTGDKFFYVNPLAFLDWDGDARSKSPKRLRRNTNRRQDWFGCSCCPNNLSRLVASIGEYAYSESRDGISVHLFIDSQAVLDVAGQQVTLVQTTRYPWEGTTKITLEPEKPAGFTLRVRIPGWCTGYSIRLNGEPVSPSIEKGYAVIDREWNEGDEILLEMDMPITRVYSHPLVKENNGRVAIQRGPIVYCFEEVDNGRLVDNLVLPRDAELVPVKEDILGGIVSVECDGYRITNEERWEGKLYDTSPVSLEPCRLKAIPYMLWANRDPGEMVVWIRERD